MAGRHAVAARERAGLVEAARGLGPDAPTLCTGWSVRDLLGHIWVREHDLAAVPGLVIPALHGITERRERAAVERLSFERLLADLAAGPPLPFGVPGVREVANVHEFFVHHEDVRRANGESSRPPDAHLDAALWWRLRANAVVLCRRVHGVRVTLRRSDGGSINARPFATGAEVVVVGPPPELFLFCFNRKGASEVSLQGDQAAIDQLLETDLGL